MLGAVNSLLYLNMGRLLPSFAPTLPYLQEAQQDILSATLHFVDNSYADARSTNC